METQEKSATEQYNRRERLRKRAKKEKKLDQAPRWEPWEGDEDVLIVTLKYWRKIDHPKYGVWYAVYGEDEDGQLWELPTYHGVLEGEFEEKSPDIKEEVVLMYNGKVEREEGNSYYVYKLLTQTDEEEAEETYDSLPF